MASEIVVVNQDGSITRMSLADGQTLSITGGKPVVEHTTSNSPTTSPTAALERHVNRALDILDALGSRHTYIRENIDVYPSGDTVVRMCEENMIIPNDIAPNVRRNEATAAVIRVLDARKQLVNREHAAVRWEHALRARGVDRVDIKLDEPIIAHVDGTLLQIGGIGCHFANVTHPDSPKDVVELKKHLIKNDWDTTDFVTFTNKHSAGPS